MLSLVEVLIRTTDFFQQKGIETARLDAELLVGDALGLDRVGVYLQHDRPMTQPELAAIRERVARRGKREPVAWILGQQGFHAIELQVGPGVLVPRADTETLVDAALALIAPEEDVFVADPCCGSGAVGLAIASARPQAKVFATDLSMEALACAKANVSALGLDKRVAVLRGSLLEPIPPARPIDLVVSNPPYIPTADFADLAPEVRDHEPRLALDGGQDGLDIYRALVPAAAARARRAVLVEIGHEQGPAVCALFAAAGLKEVVCLPDLAGRDRVVQGLK